ncbi:Biosynthetic Aromatic amino acid aminotransferase alpha (EC @ Aspartate aminotransferase (EC [Olavius algarvensis associated proteobacterium Delta 3]|nr:Biosynthetic Aromatic amino acid aminotransferase alpha (EC @ Aspartate aminotransferase (EC [Olavius algarvensis associated proteobacterium Delta 3]CAB5157499.1 Biosynthetic Aromatic amino acid aminotransferase alpha (EC @ Aspartate aminotransferase (EC [Olavius algarvensis associated proteobacterium Delta 3]
MTIAKKIETFIEKSSWIRKMFEEGTRLKAEHGPEKVFDFSLGNPNVPPPEKFHDVLKTVVEFSGPGVHGYMPNTGYPFVREAVAEYLSGEHRVPLSGDDIIMTCGAAGALNTILKALLDPGDEVLTPTPFFVEYTFYADNHGGSLKTVPTHADFSLDLDAIAGAITPQTKIVLINSPNNPTGQVYPEKDLQGLGALLESRSRALGRTIYLVSDEPYRKIVYDGIDVPSILGVYPDSIVAASYSKDISLAGERLGYIAIHPEASHKPELLAGMTLTNRILGFVNAPALMQRVVAQLQGVTVDVDEYARKRKLLCDGLADAGYDFVWPPGAFYLFPRSPIPDDVEFVRALQAELILVVPGSGFGGPGHFRISYCVDDDTIVNAMPGFKRVIDKYK